MSTIKSILRRFNWAVIAALIVLSVLLGLLNNLRVDDEKRVNWFGGAVSSEEDVDMVEVDT